MNFETNLGKNFLKCQKKKKNNLDYLQWHKNLENPSTEEAHNWKKCEL